MAGKIRQTNWNRKRRLGVDAELKLLRYSQEDGEVELLTVPSGWNAGVVPGADTSHVSLRIEEQAGITEELMLSNLHRFSITAKGVTRTYRVVDGGVTPPFARSREWGVAGEEIRERP